MVRMAQTLESLRYPMLVDGQGNFGSIDGDSPAAMRYTEATLAQELPKRCSPISIRKRLIFRPNFDDSTPGAHGSYQRATSQDLLVNGASGIAVGMATNMPPHNLVGSGRWHRRLHPEDNDISSRGS